MGVSKTKLKKVLGKWTTPIITIHTRLIVLASRMKLVHPRRSNGRVYLEIHVELFTVSHKHQPLKGHAYVGAQQLCNVQSGSVISVFTMSSWIGKQRQIHICRQWFIVPGGASGYIDSWLTQLTANIKILHYDRYGVFLPNLLVSRVLYEWEKEGGSKRAGRTFTFWVWLLDWR